MRVRLIDDVRSAWRFSSIRVQLVAGSLIGTWMAMPEEYRAALLDVLGVSEKHAAAAAAIVWLLANSVARITKVEKS